MHEVFRDYFDGLASQVDTLLKNGDHDSEELNKIFKQLKHALQSVELSVRGHTELADAKGTVEDARARFADLEARRHQLASDKLPEPVKYKIKGLRDIEMSNSKQLDDVLRMAIDAEQHSQSAAYNLMTQREALQRSRGNMDGVKSSVNSANSALGKVKRWWL